SVERVSGRQLAANVTRKDCPPGEYVVLVVRDTGSGLSPDVLGKIFDPFFTTKFTGRGLGLSAVLGILRAHEGLLTGEREVGKGSTVPVFLPKASIPVQSKSTGEAVARGTGTVLVVDDEEVVRTTARAALTKLGYNIITASNGEEALRIYASMRDRIVAVLLDMTMPVMDGEETLTRLTEMRRDVVVVATSGYDECEAQVRFGNRIAGFVQKPFTLGQLGVKM